MTKEPVQIATEKLQEVGPSVALTFIVTGESYFEVMTGLVDNFCRDNDLGCIYVAVSVPARTISSALDSLEIKHDHVRFIDCISYATMQTVNGGDMVTYVESPAMLENIILRVDYMFRKSDKKRNLVIVDSIGALAMHNDARMISEFVQTLMTLLKSRDAYPVMLSIGEPKQDIKEMLVLVSDQVVPIGSKSAPS